MHIIFSNSHFKILLQLLRIKYDNIIEQSLVMTDTDMKDFEYNGQDLALGNCEVLETLRH
jgi:hypothetical protein